MAKQYKPLYATDDAAKRVQKLIRITRNKRKDGNDDLRAVGEEDSDSDNPGDMPNIKLVRLQTRWFRNSAGLWQATACELDEFNQVDLTKTYDVYAPLAYGDPDGTPRWEKFYIIYKNDRWESIQTLLTIAKYKSGDHVAIYLDGVGPDYIVDNTGVTRANTVNNQGIEVGQSRTGLLAFDSKNFEVGNISDAIKGIKLKHTVKQVVTNVELVDGQLRVTKEWITQVPDSY